MNQKSEKLNRVFECLEITKKTYDLIESKLAISKRVCLFGAGQFGQAALAYLIKNSFEVVCFIDSSPSKLGSLIDGVPVVSFDNELVKNSDVIFITVKHSVQEIINILDGYDLKISFDAYFLHKNITLYLNIRNTVFKDGRSKECLDGVMLTMITGDEGNCINVMDFNQYFCLPEFVNVGTDYFVDAGAYVGDTVEKFIWANNGAFKHIYAFEPSRLQYDALVVRRKRLIQEWALSPGSFEIINAGLGSSNYYAAVNIVDDHLLGATLTEQSFSSKASQIEVFSLDNFIKDRRVTFIKSDIEGMEMEMLYGARNTILKNKPKMALSIYHKPDDFINIVNFVLEVDAHYSLYLRHHSPMLMDTTLYCVKKT